MTDRIRVLVVDDSAFARKVLREVLSASPEIEVVGVARDGLEALEKIAQLKPDVVTLDLVMPNLGGLGVLENLPADLAPRVVLVSSSSALGDLAVQALQSGAFDLVHKPTALATDQLYELRDELIAKVRAAARARGPSGLPAVPARALTLPPSTARQVLVIGTSTGGPQALTRLLTGIPRDFPLPIVVALHIPAGYTEAMAKRLHAACAIDVCEASDHMAVRPGLAIIARGGMHLRLERAGTLVYVKLDSEPTGSLYSPSVNALFHSAVQSYGAGVIGVVLTGMGDDGMLGAGAIREAGGIVLTESESSCVIYGMPRCVVESGFSSASAKLSEMAATIISHL